MEAARPAVRYQKLQDSEEPQVTVHLYSRPARWVIQEKQRETCVRIFAAILLLAVALSFAYYQLTHGEEKQPDSEESKWALVNNSYWNHVWENDLESQQNGKEGQSGGLDEEEKTENHLSEEDEAGHHHDEEEDADHHHGDEEEADHHHGEDEENGHHHDDEDQADQPSRSHTHEHGVYHHATVLTASDVCSKAGKDILTAGGNIVDAGVAALLCLCVVHPHAAGIGGVLSAVYYNTTSGHARALNAMPTSSSRRFGIPLVLQGLWVIHQQYGVLEWAKLLNIPIQMAEEGFRIDSVLARALRENEDQVKSSNLHEWFCYTNGSLKEEGAVLANPKLAEMLQSSTTMVKGGALPEAVVQHLSEDLSSAGLSPSERLLFTDAMKASTVEFENASSFELDGFHLYAAPPPASGNIIGDILKQVNRRKLAVTSIDGEQSTVETYLHILNSSKYGYALGLGDILRGRTSNSSGLPVTAKDVASLSFADIGAHIATADSHGNVLLISVSLNSSFGSRFISSSTGILLSDFAFSVSSDPLFWACPVVVKPYDEDDVLGVGATGGSSVPIAVAQSIIKHIYFEKPLAEVTGGPLLDVDIGVDGVVHSFISGFSNLSEVSLSQFDKEPEVTVLNRTDVFTPVLLVESHAEHVRAFGSPTAYCHFDGI